MNARTMENAVVSGWTIRQADRWFIALPRNRHVHKIFEAPTLRVLIHKIELWSQVEQASAGHSVH